MKKQFFEIDPATNKNIFEAEYNIADTLGKRLENEYEDVFNGTKHDLLLIPESFQYSQDMSLSIQGLEDRINEEKLKIVSANYQKEEIKRMENVLKNMKF